MIGAVLDSLRVRQWVKNGVIFAPLVFSGRLLEPASFTAASLSFGCFCLASSGVYLMNDLLDRRVDRFHPAKRSRPIVSGRLPVAEAFFASALLMLGSLTAALWLNPGLGFVLLLYLILNACYSFSFKRQVILDVMTISAGFVLRIWGGAVVLAVLPSHWLQLSMFFLGLFLGLAKRRQELHLLRGVALRHRKVLADYSPAFIDQLTAILSAVAILCYSLYAVSPEVTARVGQFGFIYTVPFVVYGVFRYLYLVHIRQEALDPTEALLTDGPMILSMTLWIIAVLFILY